MRYSTRLNIARLLKWRIKKCGRTLRKCWTFLYNFEEKEEEEKEKKKTCRLRKSRNYNSTLLRNLFPSFTFDLKNSTFWVFHVIKIRSTIIRNVKAGREKERDRNKGKERLTSAVKGHSLWICSANRVRCYSISFRCVSARIFSSLMLSRLVVRFYYKTIKRYKGAEEKL